MVAGWDPDRVLSRVGRRSLGHLDTRGAVESWAASGRRVGSHKPARVPAAGDLFSTAYASAFPSAGNRGSTITTFSRVISASPGSALRGLRTWRFSV